MSLPNIGKPELWFLRKYLKLDKDPELWLNGSLVATFPVVPLCIDLQNVKIDHGTNGLNKLVDGFEGCCSYFRL